MNNAPVVRNELCFDIPSCEINCSRGRDNESRTICNRKKKYFTHVRLVGWRLEVDRKNTIVIPFVFNRYYIVDTTAAGSNYSACCNVCANRIITRANSCSERFIVFVARIIYYIIRSP